MEPDRIIRHKRIEDGGAMMLQTPLPAVNDTEGDQVPEFYPPVVDAHVHVFPEGIFKAIWKWFGEYGWPIRYPIPSEQLLSFLLEKGIAHVIALQYAHKPGIAVDLNRFMLDLCRKFPGRVTGMATVFPGEEKVEKILSDAFDGGLGGVKLHSHVQCFDMSSKEMQPIYEICAASGKPLVMHVGREPKSPGYSCDPYLICKAEKLDVVLSDYPALKVCVPHLGADEFLAYQFLLEKYDNLWLDTAMAVTDYLPACNPVALSQLRPDRVMYGSDFPNIPFAWDRELKEIGKQLPGKGHLASLLAGNARDFFNLT